MSDRRDIPSIPEAGLTPDLRRALMRMREELQALMGLRGTGAAAVRWSDEGSFGSGGGTTVIGGGGGGGGGGEEDPPDLTPPPSPETFAAVPGISVVFLSWSGIGYTQGHGNKQTLIYGVQKTPGDPTLPVFGDAQLVATATHALDFFALPSEPNRRWHLWAKFETNDGVLSPSPAGGVNGVTVTTGLDVRHLIEVLTQAAENPALPYSRLTLKGDLIHVADGSGAHSPVFTVVTVPFSHNGVTVPPGVYMTDAMIANGTITNAMIGQAVIDDAKIATLSAAKFTGGQMRVGSFLQSTNYTSGASGVGFKINADGTAELQAAYIRGQLTASQINVSNLSALSSNLGTVTAGSMNTTGYIAVAGGSSYSIKAPADGGDITRSVALMANYSFAQDFGVVGYVNQSSIGAGVYGYNANAIGGTGVWGRGFVGVFGKTSASTGHGVQGESIGSGAGLYGKAPSMSTGYGVISEGRTFSHGQIISGLSASAEAPLDLPVITGSLPPAVNGGVALHGTYGLIFSNGTSWFRYNTSLLAI